MCSQVSDSFCSFYVNLVQTLTNFGFLQAVVSDSQKESGWYLPCRRRWQSIFSLLFLQWEVVLRAAEGNCGGQDETWKTKKTIGKNCRKLFRLANQNFIWVQKPVTRFSRGRSGGATFHWGEIPAQRKPDLLPLYKIQCQNSVFWTGTDEVRIESLDITCTGMFGEKGSSFSWKEHLSSDYVGGRIHLALGLFTASGTGNMKRVEGKGFH